MDTNGLSFLYCSTLGQRLASHFANSRQSHFQSFAFQQVNSIFGSHADNAGYKVP